YQTPASQIITSSDFSPHEPTFDFPLYPSLAKKLSMLELVVWDKDIFIKMDYLGEVVLHLK
ncbi:hypothetical protein BDQ12DRAFT_617634, partial [Crucibulum laeve]